MQAADACCRELSCALLLALTCLTSEKTPQRNQSCAFLVEGHHYVLSNICTTPQVPFGAGSLWTPVFFWLFARGKLPVSHSTGQKKGFFSVLHLHIEVIP